jgi:hypothetical protein
VKLSELASGRKLGNNGPTGVSPVVLTAVPLTVPVPSPLNVRVPSTENENPNTWPSIGCSEELKPAFGFGVVFPGIGWLVDEPGATRQLAVMFSHGERDFKRTRLWVRRYLGAVAER